MQMFLRKKLRKKNNIRKIIHFNIISIVIALFVCCSSNSDKADQVRHKPEKLDLNSIFKNNQVSITHVDTATVLIKIAGFTILTDPVFDSPGEYYHHGFGAFSKKTANPSIAPKTIKKIDLVLLSHNHQDNFDTSGRMLAKKASLVLTTKNAAKELKNAKGLDPWETHSIQMPNGQKLLITATPARHHPAWLPEFVSGPSIGFVLQIENEKKAMYITGDTVFYDGIKEVASKFQVALALVHVGSAEFWYLSGGGQYTMDAQGYMDTVNVINPMIAIPIHNNGWTHFDENNFSLLETIKNHSTILNRTLIVKRGEEIKFGATR